MKIIINTSNLSVGGGLQVALSFIDELRKLDKRHEYHIFTSLAIDMQLERSIFKDNFSFYSFDESPASLKKRVKVVRKLNMLESKIKPNIVFTVFGPSYWKPKGKHLMGFADGWLYNPNSVAYLKLTFLKRLRMRLLERYKSFYLKRDAKYFVLETEDARFKFSETLKINKNQVYVVGNTYSTFFNKNKYQEKGNEFYLKLPNKEENEFRFLYIAHNHPAKNLAIINDIYPLLEGLNIKFVLTIDEESYQKLFFNKSYIINLGPIKQASCPSVYKQCDALFAPTLLETFSAVYPESMKMELPILTSNYSFATDICQNAALYFDPLNPKDIAGKIIEIKRNENLRVKLINNGKNQIKIFETANSRALKYIQLCETIIQGDNNVQK